MNHSETYLQHRILFVVIFIFGFCSISAGSVWADEKDEIIQKLMTRVDKLENKVEVLTDKLSVYEQKPASAAAVSDEAVEKKVNEVLAKKEETEGGLLKAIKDINVSGFVDTSYEYNMNHPDSRSNTARVFDTEANNFSVQAGKLSLEKLPPDEGGAGFRTDLYFGQDAEVITPTGSTRDQFDVEQAYVSIKPSEKYNLPFGKWQAIKVGKFVTMHGAEVIEAKDNWNFSRSLLFGYAIPFTHTGIRAGYQLSDSVTGYLGINNGWDVVKDNNKTKSGEAALSWTANDKLSMNLAGMYGPEQTSNDHSQRGLVDFVATYKPFNKWTFMVNGDYAHEQDTLTKGKDGDWWGVAGYARYDVNDKVSLSQRAEFFSDQQGLRVMTGVPEDLWETTSTLEVRPFKDLITRLEYRHDESSASIFTDDKSPSDTQDTIALEVIKPF